MQTINELNQQIQKNQDRIEAENRAALQERAKASSYTGDQIEQAQAHTNAAMQHEQNSLQIQTEITDLMNTQQQIQTELNELERQKSAVNQQRSDELSRLEAQIAKLRGGI